MFIKMIVVLMVAMGIAIHSDAADKRQQASFD